MINIGFDFDIELGLFWLRERAGDLKSEHIVRKVEETLTSLYQTSVVIYHSPELLFLAALSIVAVAEDINMEFSGWSPTLRAQLEENASQVKEIRDLYLAKRSFMYD